VVNEVYLAKGVDVCANSIGTIFFFSEKIALNADKKRIALVYFGYLYYLCR